MILLIIISLILIPAAVFLIVKMAKVDADVCNTAEVVKKSIPQIHSTLHDLRSSVENTNKKLEEQQNKPKKSAFDFIYNIIPILLFFLLKRKKKK